MCFTSDFASTKWQNQLLRYERYFKGCGKILDIGCSVGNFVMNAPKKIMGIDIDEGAVKKCQEKGLNVKCKNIEDGLDFVDESFDGINCTQVIEHLNNPLKFMKEIYRILQKGGIAVIETPDFVIASKRHSSPKHTNFYDDYTHKTPFTKASLAMIAYDAGFRNYKVKRGYKENIGLGWLRRNTKIPPKMILNIQDVFLHLGLHNDYLVLIVTK